MNVIGAGIAVIGASVGIAILAQAALNGMARQPEVASKLQTAMIIAGALIEGVALFAIVVALLSK
ncbi:MAG: ATP synthase F0 subunit C [bacterium]|nr:ATP synthase F0 subunit C [bacterium]MDO5462535.1 ATP synthase F0 subunit C [bacterium]